VRWVSWLRGAQEGEHGKHAAVISRRLAEPELGDDLADVGLHGLGAKDQLVADALVGVALGHQGEDLTLAVCQLSERAAVAPAGHEPRDDGRVDDALALGDRSL